MKKVWNNVGCLIRGAFHHRTMTTRNVKGLELGALSWYASSDVKNLHRTMLMKWHRGSKLEPILNTIIHSNTNFKKIIILELG